MLDIREQDFDTCAELEPNTTSQYPLEAFNI